MTVEVDDQILILPEPLARTMPPRLVQQDTADVSDHVDRYDNVRRITALVQAIVANR